MSQVKRNISGDNVNSVYVCVGVCVCASLSSPVLLQLVLHHLTDLVTVPLQRVESVLDGLVDGALHLLAHLLYLVGTSAGLEEEEDM